MIGHGQLLDMLNTKSKEQERQVTNVNPRFSGPWCSLHIRVRMPLFLSTRKSTSEASKNLKSGFGSSYSKENTTVAAKDPA